MASVIGQWLINQLEMMPIHLLEHSLSLPGSDRLIERFFDEQETAQVHDLVNRPPASSTRPATVLLPGILGSLLASNMGIGALLWINPTVIADGQINLLELNERGDGDRSPDVNIIPVGIEKLVYLKLMLALVRQTRLYEFPYDWRRPLEYNADCLHRALARWSAAEPHRRFVLIGHSMGGLVARTYMHLYPREAETRIERLVMMGTPLRGAPLSAVGFFGGNVSSRVVRRINSANDILSLVLNMPSCYQLLPPPQHLFDRQRAYPLNWDPYDAAGWPIPGIRQDWLDRARRTHGRAAAADPQVETVQIAGCHRRTVIDLQHTPDAATPEGAPCGYTPIYGEIGRESGDDTVPLWSSCVDGIDTYYVEDSHLGLPSNTDVLDAVIALAHGERPDLPTALPEPKGIIPRLRASSIMQQATEWRQRLDQGNLSREDIFRIFFT
jgi:pimeloyl-ACP methyl ester carboxylesterase